MDRLEIDGSMGEGGGQVLRSALSLSVLTGRPFRIRNIRARRRKPGLAPQHLQAIRAAAEISGARYEGAGLGFTELAFEPGAVRSGTFRFAIGTAGATSLVLQTVAFPLSMATEASEVEITGGTHVPWSPCYHYLETQWAPVLAELGYSVGVALERAGFYPRGGGRIRARIVPAAGGLRPLQRLERGRLKEVRGLSAVAGLDRSIAARQARQARRRLADLEVPVQVEVAELPAASPGTVVVLTALFENSRCTSSALGDRGKPAERVADEAVGRLRGILASGAAIDEHLADQLLVPLSLVPALSAFTVARVTDHLTTNGMVAGLFLPGARVEISGVPGAPGRVVVRGVELVSGGGGRP